MNYTSDNHFLTLDEMQKPRLTIHKPLLKTGILLLVLLLNITACKVSREVSNQEPRKITVSGMVVHTQSWCKGVGPSHADEAALRNPGPLKNFKMVFNPVHPDKSMGQTAIVVVTDQEGRYSIELPAGEWCLRLGEKLDELPEAFTNSEFFIFREECDAEWRTKCNDTFTVANQALELKTIQLHTRCFVGSYNPCLKYVGPLPP